MNRSEVNAPFRILAAALLISILIAAGTFWWKHRDRSSQKAASLSTLGRYQILADVHPSTPRTGSNRIQLEIKDPAGKPVSKLQINGKARMSAMGSMPEMVSGADFKYLGSGRYESDVDLTMSGTWQLQLHLEDQSGTHLDVQYSLTTGIPGLEHDTTDLAGSNSGNDDVAYYTCSMHPSVRSNDPGSCPICGMNLVAVKSEEIRSGVITLDSGRRQAIGVTTQAAQIQQFNKVIRTTALVTHDETRLSEVTLKYSAWIGEVFANSMGKQVKKGEPLFTVYSPELLSAQQEYLESLKSSRGAPLRKSTILAAARERLLLWGFQASQLHELMKRGAPEAYVPFLSPVTGTIIEKNVVEGSAVSNGHRLYKLSDLSRVWIEAELYEDELNLLAVEQQVEFEFTYYPGTTYTGKISFIYPYLNQQTRTGRVRVLAENEEGKLRPGMYAQIKLKVPLGEKLVIPEEAILYAGDRSVVFVDLGSGKLKPQRIRTGAHNEDFVVVTDGLDAGTEIVTSGTFLIASESKLKSGIKQW